MTFSTGTNGTSGTGLDYQRFSPSRFFNFLSRLSRFGKMEQMGKGDSVPVPSRWSRSEFLDRDGVNR